MVDIGTLSLILLFGVCLGTSGLSTNDKLRPDIGAAIHLYGCDAGAIWHCAGHVFVT